MQGHATTGTHSRSEFWLNRVRVIPERRLVIRAGREVRLERKAMAVLLCLAERPGRVVSRSDLIARVWGPGGATADLVSRAIGLVRRSLGSEPGSPTIETIRGTGYCLVGIVHERCPTTLPADRPAPRRLRLGPVAKGSLSFAATAALWLAVCQLIGLV